MTGDIAQTEDGAQSRRLDCFDTLDAVLTQIDGIAGCAAAGSLQGKDLLGTAVYNAMQAIRRMVAEASRASRTLYEITTAKD